jgi:hypothetical protein
MARFYQPRETQGIYDRSDNSLTVNQYDPVRIGFRAISTKEYQDTTVDTSEDVEDGRVTVDSLAYEIDIKTEIPVEFTLTARQDVIMSPVGKDVAPPLEVYVRRATWLTTPAVGQERDPAGCWAACLSFWLSAAPGRSERSFINIVGDFNGLWDSNGFIRTTGLMHQLAAQRGRYHMSTARINPNQLDRYIGRWPLLIGFRHPAGFGHMNVLTRYDEDNDLVRAMDPWFPDPPPNCITRYGGQVVFNGNEGDFSFSGYFGARPLGYYRHPVPSGTLFVGYPEEYDHRMP